MADPVQRKLTTILAADAEGYSRVMETDEIRGLGALKAALAIFSDLIRRRHGRIANTAGDGLIAEFPSVVEAVQCAIEVQSELAARPDDPGDRLNFRIGIHLGDVLINGNDLLGEGVNLAARLQAMAEPGGIVISQQVFDQVQGKLTVGFEYLGDRRPKNYSRDLPVYRVTVGAGGAGAGAADPAGTAFGLRQNDPAPASPPGLPPPPPGDTTALRARVIRHARLLGATWAGLLVVDLTTGAPFWAEWPGILFALVLGLEVAPLFARGWFDRQLVRSLVIVAALILVNAVTWSGYPWSMWAVGALVTVRLLRRWRARAP